MSDHVAWLRFNDHNGRTPTTLHLCDSDAPGAFKVYRHPPALECENAALREALAEAMMRWMSRESLVAMGYDKRHEWQRLSGIEGHSQRSGQ